MNDTGMNSFSDDILSHRYSSVVEEHFTQPRHAGTLTGHYEITLNCTAGRREHGTEVVFHVGVEDGRIGEIAFQAFGCPHTIAACSVLTEHLTGKPIEALDRVSMDELAAEIDLPVDKTGRLLVIEDALRKCLEAWDNTRLG